MRLVLEYALNCCSECSAQTSITEPPTKEITTQPEPLPLCLRVANEALPLSESFQLTLNPHWLTPCLEPNGTHPVHFRISSRCGETLIKAFPLVFQRSDGVLRVQRAADELFLSAPTQAKQAFYHNVNRGESLTIWLEGMTSASSSCKRFPPPFRAPGTWSKTQG
ncbi:MAG: hypothetical protein NZM65_06315 [Flavobacteriales bacterium]|nr:hypothetical protein [Flavobacteriales bacterium]MDW8410287.1 hypothetical protein [Flavobacteriales bacterium]